MSLPANCIPLLLQTAGGSSVSIEWLSFWLHGPNEGFTTERTPSFDTISSMYSLVDDKFSFRTQLQCFASFLILILIQGAHYREKSGNQGILWGKNPCREKSGNLEKFV